MDEETRMRCSPYANKWDPLMSCAYKKLPHRFTDWQLAINFDGRYRYCTTCGMREDQGYFEPPRNHYEQLHNLERDKTKGQD